MAINLNTSSLNLGWSSDIIGHPSELAGTIENDGAGHPSIQFTWTDPIPEGVPYGGTKLVVKENSTPRNDIDGTIVVDTMEKDKYKTIPFNYAVPNKTPGLKNIYATLFPYSSSGEINKLKKCTINLKVTVGEVLKKLVQNGTNINLTSTYSENEYGGGAMYNGVHTVAMRKNSNATCTICTLTKEAVLTDIIDLPSEGIEDFTNWYSSPVLCVLNGELFIFLTYMYDGANKKGVAIFKYNGTTVTKIYNGSPTGSTPYIVSAFTIDEKLYICGSALHPDRSGNTIVEVNSTTGEFTNVTPDGTTFATRNPMVNSDGTVSLFIVLNNRLKQTILSMGEDGKFAENTVTHSMVIGQSEIGIMDGKVLVMDTSYKLMEVDFVNSNLRQICDTTMVTGIVSFIDYGDMMLTTAGNGMGVVRRYDYVEL